MNKSSRDQCLKQLMAAVSCDIMRFHESSAGPLKPTQRYSYQKTVELLLEFGADWEDDFQGTTILEIVAMDDSCESIRSTLIRHIVKMQYY